MTIRDGLAKVAASQRGAHLRGPQPIDRLLWLTHGTSVLVATITKMPTTFSTFYM
jgi:hypothetical protein